MQVKTMNVAQFERMLSNTISDCEKGRSRSKQKQRRQSSKSPLPKKGKALCQRETPCRKRKPPKVFSKKLGARIRNSTSGLHYFEREVKKVSGLCRYWQNQPNFEQGYFNQSETSIDPFRDLSHSAIRGAVQVRSGTRTPVRRQSSTRKRESMGRSSRIRKSSIRKSKSRRMGPKSLLEGLSAIQAGLREEEARLNDKQRDNGEGVQIQEFILNENEVMFEDSSNKENQQNKSNFSQKGYPKSRKTPLKSSKRQSHSRYGSGRKTPIRKSGFKESHLKSNNRSKNMTTSNFTNSDTNYTPANTNPNSYQPKKLNFRPKLSKKSMMMAAKMEPSMQRLRDGGSRRKKTNLVQECPSFTPKINKRSKQLAKRSRMQSGSDRIEALHKMADHRDKKRQRLKSEQDQLRAQLQQQECVFRPELVANYEPSYVKDLDFVERSYLWNKKKEEKIDQARKDLHDLKSEIDNSLQQHQTQKDLYEYQQFQQNYQKSENTHFDDYDDYEEREGPRGSEDKNKINNSGQDYCSKGEEGYKFRVDDYIFDC